MLIVMSAGIVGVSTFNIRMVTVEKKVLTHMVKPLDVFPRIDEYSNELQNSVISSAIPRSMAATE